MFSRTTWHSLLHSFQRAFPSAVRRPRALQHLPAKCARLETDIHEEFLPGNKVRSLNPTCASQGKPRPVVVPTVQEQRPKGPANEPARVSLWPECVSPLNFHMLKSWPLNCWYWGLEPLIRSRWESSRQIHALIKETPEGLLAHSPGEHSEPSASAIPKRAPTRIQVCWLPDLALWSF